MMIHIYTRNYLLCFPQFSPVWWQSRVTKCTNWWHIVKILLSIYLGCVNPMLNIALLNLSKSSYLWLISPMSYRCKLLYHLYLLFLSTSPPFSFSWLPFRQSDCPSVVISSSNVASPYPFSLFNPKQDICDASLLSDGLSHGLRCITLSVNIYSCKKPIMF